MQNQPPQQNASTTPSSNPHGRLTVSVVICLIIGFIIGYGISWLWNRHQAAGLAEEMNAAQLSDASTTLSATQGDGISTASAGSITVANQPAGSSVFVSKAVFGDNGGWVAIEDDINGLPGRILGAGFFAPGSNSGEVPLLRSTVPGTTYFAVMRDNVGDSEVFNMETDEPLVDPSGNTVMTVFSTR